MKFKALITTGEGVMVEQEFELADDHPIARAIQTQPLAAAEPGTGD